MSEGKDVRESSSNLTKLVKEIDVELDPNFNFLEESNLPEEKCEMNLSEIP
jgi:hypothetical protein